MQTEIIETAVVVNSTSLEEKINIALEKQNLTSVVLHNLKSIYGSLTIDGVNDVNTLHTAIEGKKLCVKLRTGTMSACKLGREEAIKEQKLWLAKEKEVVSQISEVENRLKSEIEKVENEKREIVAQKVQHYADQFAFYGKDIKAIDLIDKPVTTILSELEEAKAEFEEKQRIQIQKEENERKERELADREAKLKAFEEAQRNADIKARADAAFDLMIDALESGDSLQAPNTVTNTISDLLIKPLHKNSFWSKLNHNEQNEFNAIIKSYQEDILTLVGELASIKEEVAF